MFEVKVTIGFNAETLAIFSALAGNVKASSGSKVVYGNPGPELMERPSVTNGQAVKVAPVNGKEKVEEPENEDEGGTATPTKVIPIEEVRAAVHTKTQAGKIAEVKGLLEKIGVARVTALKEDQRADFLKQVNSL
jgi:hypothetical protein